MKIEKTIWFHNVKIAYCGESFYCLFRSKTTQFWKAVVYITDNENRDEIDQLLISQGIELIGLESQNHEVSSAQ